MPRIIGWPRVETRTDIAALAVREFVTGAVVLDGDPLPIVYP